MKVHIKKVKNVAPNKNMIKKVVAVILSIAVIIISYIAMTKASEDAVNTVPVIRVKNEKGIEMNALITKEGFYQRSPGEKWRYLHHHQIKAGQRSIG